MGRLAAAAPALTEVGRARCLWAVPGVLALILALLLGYHSPAPTPTVVLRGDAVWPAGRILAPDLHLTDQTGQAVSLSRLRGHVVLLTFLDSLCTKDCPIEGRQLADVQRALGSQVHPLLLVVSVNPVDRPATARAFMAKSGLTGAWSWHWLMGTTAELSPVWRSYGVTVQRQSGDIAHSTVLYLIDSRGYERAGYLFPLLPADLVHDIPAVAGSGRRGWL